MAEISYAPQSLDLKNPLTLKAAGLVAADTAEAGVVIGKGLFLVKIAWTACEIDTSTEIYNITFDANTVAAPTTWKRLGGQFVAGKGAVTGGDDDTAASGEVAFAISNPYDYQVRVNTWVNGTIATGMNFAVYAYPVNQAAF